MNQLDPICFRGNVHDFERDTLADNSGELTDSEILGEIRIICQPMFIAVC